LGQSQELAGILGFRVSFQACLSKRREQVGCSQEKREQSCQCMGQIGHGILGLKKKKHEQANRCASRTLQGLDLTP
jgi:hypothetical protein